MMSNVKLDSFTYRQTFENEVVYSSIGDAYNLKASISKNLSAIENMVYRFGERALTNELRVQAIEENYLDTVLVKGLFLYLQGRMLLSNLTFDRLVFIPSITPIDEKKSEFKVEIIAIKEK